ncbi:hypothetical protein [Rahnella aceris]|jgi:hypothetical protein
MSNPLYNFDGLHDETLKKFHVSATNAYKSDRSLSVSEKEVAQQFGNRLAYYGTDYFSDWPEYVDALEEELVERNISFTPIVK